MTTKTPLPVVAAAAKLGVFPGELRAWIRSGAPTVQRGGQGRGNCTLVDVQAIRAWRTAKANEQALVLLATELPHVLANAMESALHQIEIIPEAKAAAVLTGSWYVGSIAVLDHLRMRCPSIPDLTTEPEAIKRLRELAKR